MFLLLVKEESFLDYLLFLIRDKVLGTDMVQELGLQLRISKSLYQDNYQLLVLEQGMA